jgi:hypothetical protein
MPSRHGAKLNTGQLYLYLLELNEAMCLENRAKFENVSLSVRRTVYCVELINKDLPQQLNKTVETFLYFSIALGVSTDTSHTAHLLVFMQGVNGSQGITLHEGYKKQTN